MLNHDEWSTVDELRGEIRRLREDNSDLRASASLWADLYVKAAMQAFGINIGGTMEPDDMAVDAVAPHTASLHKGAR